MRIETEHIGAIIFDRGKASRIFWVALLPLLGIWIRCNIIVFIPQSKFVNKPRAVALAADAIPKNAIALGRLGLLIDWRPNPLPQARPEHSPDGIAAEEIFFKNLDPKLGQLSQISGVGC